MLTKVNLDKKTKNKNEVRQNIVPATGLAVMIIQKEFVAVASINKAYNHLRRELNFNTALEFGICE